MTPLSTTDPKGLRQKVEDLEKHLDKTMRPVRDLIVQRALINHYMGHMDCASIARAQITLAWINNEIEAHKKKVR